ncbi:hypothetical protein [Phreatobacter sp.]|nr:hypothetical protein [Phreatobacter sp.]MCZ8315970.1 hypothetical protein [Phreatobacter sp.]
MNRDRVESHWKQLKGKLQERYGYARDQAASEVDSWSHSSNWLP